MMLIRHLAVLGALTALVVSQSTEDPPTTGTLYDDGCPCFHQEDVDAFITFAASADNCSISDYSEGSYVSMSVSANILSTDNIMTYHSLSVDNYDSAGSCGSGISYSDVTTSGDFYGSGDASKSAYASLPESYSAQLAECQALFEDVKVSLANLDCSLYPCPFPCVNGDCAADKCTCYPGWTGDSCEECDEDACVNGVCIPGAGCQCNPGWAYPTCTECDIGWTGDNCDECDSCGNGFCTVGGCQCNPGWAYPSCTECDVGWTGDNCDQCDPDTCVNGNCTDTGCVCNNHWDQFSYPPCTYCEYGWTGTDCDQCDPLVCVNGDCTDSGCVCKDKWIGQYCDTCQLGWMAVNGTCSACDAGWMGENCDKCDPELCADGFCSSCQNGQCTSSGCTCEAGWFGANCNRAYGSGCPCFNADDVDTFLNFAEIAGPTASCDYSSDGDYTSLNAYFSSSSYSLYVTSTICSSYNTYGSIVVIDATESAACLDVITTAGAKEKMAGFGCTTYPTTPIPIK